MSPETMTRLAPPAGEVVRHAMRELDYAERFTLHTMSAGTGNAVIQVYNFPSLVNTLFGTAWDRLSVEATKAKIVWVDGRTLAAWIRDVLGDLEFADAVEEALEGADHCDVRVVDPAAKFRGEQVITEHVAHGHVPTQDTPAVGEAFRGQVVLVEECLVARRAGMKQASRATAASNNVMTANVNGSVGLMS